MSSWTEELDPRRWEKSRIAALALLAVAFSYPYIDSYLRDFPLVGDFVPATSSVVVMLAFTMMAVGLNVVVGYAGLLDLGYVAFYAVGAYTAGWLASVQFEQVTFHFGSIGVRSDFPGIHINMWAVLVVAGFLTLLAGVIIGLPTLRLRGDYLAIVTLGFGEILPQVIRNGDSFGGFNVTNGAFGIRPIDSLGFGSAGDAVGLPESFRLASDKAIWWYFAAIFLLLATIFVSIRIRDARLGRAWIAIREDETAAAAMGVPLMRTKTWAYALGAFFGGVAGAFYASYKGGAFPADFYFNISVFLLCMVIIGGMGSVWGVVVGALILTYLNVEGLAIIGSKLDSAGIDLDPRADQEFDPTLYQFGIYGILIVAMMLLRPTGLIPERRHKVEFEEGVHDVPLYGVAHGSTLSDRRPTDE